MQSFFQRLEWHELGLQTGSYSLSGTTSNVFIRLTCDNGTSPMYWLHDPTKPNSIIFMKSTVIYFLLPIPKHIGKPFGIHIWHDNTGEQPSWFLKAVTIRNIRTEMNQARIYSIQRWLSTSHPNSKPYVHMSLRHSVNNTVGNLCRSESRQSFEALNVCIKEYHMWIGAFTSNPLSRFTKQRRTIYSFFSILLISSIIIFMRKNNSMLLVGSKKDLFCIADICLSDYHILAAAQAVVISLLPRTICSIVFERTENNVQGKESNQRAVDMDCDVTRQGKYRRCYEAKYKRKRNCDKKLPYDRSIDNREKRHGNDKRLTPRKRPTPPNGIERIHNDDHTSFKFIKRKPRSKANKTADSTKLPTIPENSAITFETEDYQFLPEIPDALMNLSQQADRLTHKFGRIFSIMLTISSGILALYMWFESRFWNKESDMDSLKAVVVAILVDSLIAQFLRPIFEYIRCFVVNQQRAYAIFDCPLSSLRNVSTHIESRWKTVNSSEVRMRYLNKIYDGKISIPNSRPLTSRKVKSKIPKRFLIKELLHFLTFSMVFTIHVWEKIDSDKYILYRSVQKDLIKWNDSNSGSVVSHCCVGIL